MLRRAASRVVGVDVARGIALLGMAAVHVLPGTDDDGSRSLTDQVFAGRSAALFAVLAGVGLALALGPRPRIPRAAATLVVRAVLIGLVGLALGEAGSGVAVILPYYAAFFVLVLPWLRAGPGLLLTSAAALALVAPVVSFAVRDELPARDAASPTLDDVTEPWQLLTELLVTGYYPATAWVAYLLVGLAVGRLGLQRRRTALGLVAAGAALAVAAHALSALLLGPLGGYDRIAEQEGLPPGPRTEAVVDAGGFGDVPTTTPWWLATDAPHTTTPLDLAATTGSALAVLGLALLVAGAVPWLLTPLAAAGSMPLSLYSAHVLVLGLTDSDDPTRYYLLQVAGALLFAVLWRRSVGRGPLEMVVAGAVRPLRAGRS